MSKRNADNLEKLLSGDMEWADCNDQELLAFEEVVDAMQRQSQKPAKAREGFQEALKSRLLSARHGASTESMKKKRPSVSAFLQSLMTSPRMAMSVAAVLVVAILATTVVYLPGFGPTQPGAFGTFSRLVINTAHAQDNFTVTPTEGDAIGIDPGTAFVVTSQEEIDPDVLKESIHLTPSVPFTFDVIDAHTFSVVPDVPLSDRTIYNLGISASFIAETGIQVAREYAWAFQVKDTFKISHTLPRHQSSGVPVNTGIEVTFSHADVQDPESLISISPQVSGRFEVHNRTVVFVPQELKPGTIYTVTVDGSAHVVGSDESLGEDYTFAFETTSEGAYSRSTFGIQEPFLQFADDQTPVIPIWAYNNQITEVDAELYAFASNAAFTDALEEKDAAPLWARYARDSHLVDTDALRLVSEVTLPVEELESRSYLRLPESLATGVYLLEIARDGRRDQVLIQSTSLSAYAQVTDTDTLVWVNDTKTNLPVVGASVSALGESALATTDSQGVGIYETPDIARQEFVNYVVVQQGSQMVVVSVERPWVFYNASGQISSEYWNYFYTDRAVYQPGDKVSYWGFLKPRAGGAIENSVRVEVSSNSWTSYYDEPLVVNDARIASDGVTFEGSFDLGVLLPGYYTVALYTGDTLVHRDSLNVQTYDKPAYSISVLPEKRAVYEGTEVPVNVEVTFFDGTPVPNMELATVFGRNEGTIVTDARGRASFTVTPAVDTCTAQEEYCAVMRANTVNVRPARAEEGLILGQATIAAYATRAFVDVTTKNDNGLVTVETEVRNVDLAKVQAGASYYDQDAYDAGPRAGANIQGEVIEIRYEREEIGEYYDFINKVTRKRYRYNRVETPFETFTGVADQNGLYTHTFEAQEDKTYKVRVFADDGAQSGHADTGHVYAPRKYRTDVTSSYYTLEQSNETGLYTLGETVRLEMRKDEERLPVASGPQYLFLEMQAGLKDHTVQASPEYVFAFTEDYLPNIYATSVYFDGTLYHTASISGFQNPVKFDYSTRALDISVEADKDRYRPGEQAELAIAVTDTEGRPVPASVNINLVDEAFYALFDESVDPLEEVYRNVPEGFVASGSTHEFAEILSADSMAEGGGCFLPGTQILMADGSHKNIEDVTQGDMVLTRKSPTSDELVAARVMNTFAYNITTYMVINDTLEVTPVHRLFINGGWQQAGELRVGDRLLNADGETVKVETITWERKPVEVYNFHVEGQHTYFANDLYVHNDKGGARESFVDTALFESVQLGANGRGTVTVALPDNLTSWRVTAQAIGGDLQAGSSITEVPVSLPVFADMVLSDEVLASDEPGVKIRTYGEALVDGDTVAIDVSSDDLGINTSLEDKAFESVYVDLGSLEGKQGARALRVDARAKGESDALVRAVDVIDSRLLATEQSFYVGSEDMQIEVPNTERVEVALSDQGQGRLYARLYCLSWCHGERVDARVASHVAQNLLATYFEEGRVDAQDLSAYQMTDGGIALLPYGESEVELSAKMAVLAPGLFDANALASYLIATLEARDASREEAALALWGLAGLGEPVLVPVERLAANESLSDTERIYVALAAMELGHKELARSIYLDVLQERGEESGAYIRVGMDSEDATTQVTALMAILAAGLQETQHEGLFAYVNEVARTTDILVVAEEALYVSRALEGWVPSPLTFELNISGESRKIELERGAMHRLLLTPEDARSLRVSNIEGRLGVTVSHQVPVANVADASRYLNLERTYHVDGVETNTFAEGDLVEIRIRPAFDANAIKGAYQVVDLLPSGLELVTSPATISPDSNRSVTYWPWRRDGKRITFITSARENWTWGNQPYMRYYARVVSPGTYTAEPAMLQSLASPGERSFSDQSTVEITR